MTTELDEWCGCPGCIFDDGHCYWQRGMTGRAPWSPDTLDPVCLPPRLVGLIGDLCAETTKTPDLSPKTEVGRHRTAAKVDRDVGSR